VIDDPTPATTEPETVELEPRRRRPARWPFVVAALMLGLGVLVVVLWPVKVPFFAMSPGPVEEVTDLVAVNDTEVFDLTGDFYLLTVGLREVNVFEYLEAQFDEKVDLIDREVIRPPGVTQEEVRRSNLEAMDRSIDAAIYVALARLGYDVGFTGEGVEVLQTVEGSPADGVLLPGDRFDTVDGQQVATSDEAASVIRSRSVGDTITLSGTRDGEPITVEITLIPHPDLEGQPMVGVVFDTIDLEMVLPVDVEVDSRSIGGPSAGMMYALTLIDLLTPEDLVKGHVVAGTGTISFDETVGAIGGVRQKVFGARSVGAEYVLVPQDNYDDALTAAGDEIEVVAVATLQDALDFLGTLEPAGDLLASG
jgi:PDZ domain-containing protein